MTVIRPASVVSSVLILTIRCTKDGPAETHNNTAAGIVLFFVRRKLNNPSDNVSICQMSIPEHTVRIISHKSQRQARKELIQRIGGCTQISYKHNLPVSITQFSYDSAIVNVVDCDYDAIDGKITKNDIVFADFRHFGNKYGTKQQYDALLRWVQQFKKLEKKIWYFYEKNSISSLGGPYGIKVDEYSFTIHLYNSQEKWVQWIDTNLDVRGIQTVNFWFREVLHVDVPTVSAEQASCIQSSTPWPIPEITMNLPKYAKVEELRHDPATNTIIIRFG
jgi:hypothetical protein